MFEYAKLESKQKEPEVVRPNSTGIPDTIKTRFENLSGFSFDDVQVHYNSGKPAQLQALAYTQGNQVYIGSGQEKHLKHELGHVVQQKQGKVPVTKYIDTIPINDDVELEQAADDLLLNKATAIPVNRSKTLTTVVQRQSDKEKTTDYFKRMAIAPLKNLNLYTHVLSDGMGDAGQLNFLHSKILTVKEQLKLDTITPLVTFEIGSSFTGDAIEIEKESRKIKIQTLAPTGTNPVYAPRTATTKRNIAGEYQSTNWEIQYPVPDPSIPPSGDKILKIKEMGKADLGGIFKAGETHDGIGYGIPAVTSVVSNETCYNALFSTYTDQYELPKFNNDIATAWLINAKPYLESNYSSYDDALKMAVTNTERLAQNNSRLLIVVGMASAAYKKEGDLNILYTNRLDNSILRGLMTKITDGFIISGGEGMYAESLGVDTPNAAPVLAGRYNFQYDELREALIKKEALTEKKFSEAKNDLKNSYRIFVFEKQCNYYQDDEKCFNLDEGMLNSYIYDNSKVKYSKSLSAIYLPYSINGYSTLSKPQIFSSFAEVKQIFTEEKNRLRGNNWFSLIDQGIASAAD